MSSPSSSFQTTTASAPSPSANEPSHLIPRAVQLLREDPSSSRPSSSLRPLSISGLPNSGTTSPGWNTVTSSARTSYTHVNLAGVMDEVAVTDEVEHQHQQDDAEERVSLCFLCVSGGRKTMSFPAETAVGRVKELLLNAWPEDWTEERPPGTTYLRILHQGKILQDEDTLLKLKFPVTLSSTSSDSAPPQTTIVHVSIRPVAPKGQNGDDDGLKKRGMMSRLMSTNSTSAAVAGTDDGEHGGGGNGRSSSCGCIIS